MSADKKIRIYVDGYERCRTSEDNITLATIYFRDYKFNAVDAAKALVADDDNQEHSKFEWLAIVHEARARLERDLDFRGR